MKSEFIGKEQIIREKRSKIKWDREGKIRSQEWNNENENK
jgi:hypothetical protein